MAIKTQQELYDLFITELQSQAPNLTDINAGAINDVIAGVASYAINEIAQVTVDNFSKTFFETANGPEITGSTDDLQALAVDHFGSMFQRPGATLATGTVTFSRPTTAAGNIVIDAGTVVKTAPDASGLVQRFTTIAAVTLSGTSINASVVAAVAGSAGNVNLGTVNLIETALLDKTITVNNASSFTGGAEAQDDATYRETIRYLIETIKGATLTAIQSKVLTVAGVVSSNPVEFIQPVINWNPLTNATVGSFYYTTQVNCYIADSNGTASAALINNVKAAIAGTRAAGVQINVIPASPISQDWIASIGLNPSGPNFATLESDTSLITNQMTLYIQGLAIGQSFLKSAAKAHIMSIFGPSGTNDLVSFTINTPTGDVIAAANNKIIPGTVAIQ